jgi:AraC-like DNA-binding protein
MELRLLRAAALLRAPDIKIVHVAEQCGFHHPGLFNTCFKRRFGVSPGVWRREQEKDPEAPPIEGNGAGSCWMQNRGLCPWPGKKA